MAVATYKQFLALPDASLLTPSATLTYVTTGTTISGADSVVKHLLDLRRQLKKKRQDVLTAVDGGNTIALELDTEIEFLLDGGAYLPGVDENFLTDRSVYLPILHMVSFANGKISQIRTSWDQGALLKQLDVIGKTGRNWPIRDSKEQLATLHACIRAVDKDDTPANGLDKKPTANNPYFVGQGPDRVVKPYAGTRPEQRSFTDILGDKVNDAPQNVVSPYAGTKPSQRSFEEILGDEEDDEPPSPSTGRGRSQSSVSRAVAPKAGSGKNFAPSRLFEGTEHVQADEDEDEDDARSEQAARKRFYRPDPSKYNHFDFVDGSDPRDAPKQGVSLDNRPKSKHDSNWSFDDFNTPHKHKPSKTFRQKEAHAATAAAAATATAASTATTAATATAPFGNITNLPDRRKDHVTAAGPSAAAKENQPTGGSEERGINIAGDGMGGRKGTDRSWMYGAGSTEPSQPSQLSQLSQPSQPTKEAITIAGDGMGGRKGTDRAWMSGGQSEKEGINIAGDGMGSRKGTDRSWLYGDGDGTEAGGQKKPGSNTASGNFSWEF